MNVWIVESVHGLIVGIFMSEEDAINCMVKDNNDSVFPDESHNYWGVNSSWEKDGKDYLYSLRSYYVMPSDKCVDDCVDRKVIVGWNDEGKFEYELGKDVRLNDLAMFSLHLGRMALGLSPNLRTSPWSTVEDEKGDEP
ncbi:MAG: hypothetical protein ACTSPB_00580 [Candidatus Thorarchaeota archaeon]